MSHDPVPGEVATESVSGGRYKEITVCDVGFRHSNVTAGRADCLRPGRPTPQGLAVRAARKRASDPRIPVARVGPDGELRCGMVEGWAMPTTGVKPDVRHNQVDGEHSVLITPSW